MVLPEPGGRASGSPGLYGPHEHARTPGRATIRYGRRAATDFAVVDALLPMYSHTPNHAEPTRAEVARSIESADYSAMRATYQWGKRDGVIGVSLSDIRRGSENPNNEFEYMDIQ